MGRISEDHNADRNVDNKDYIMRFQMEQGLYLEFNQIDHMVYIQKKNLCTFYPCPQIWLSLKVIRLIDIVEEISRQPNV